MPLIGFRQDRMLYRDDRREFHQVIDKHFRPCVSARARAALLAAASTAATANRSKAHHYAIRRNVKYKELA